MLNNNEENTEETTQPLNSETTEPLVETEKQKPTDFLGKLTPLHWTLGLAAIVGILVILVAFIATSANRNLDEREQARGVTDVVTVDEPPLVMDKAKPATTRPAELPPLIASEGECKVQLNIIRDVMDETQSGLVKPTKEQNKRFTEALQAAGAQGPGGACTPETLDAFRKQEIAPWLNWAPPAKQPSK